MAEFNEFGTNYRSLGDYSLVSDESATIRTEHAKINSVPIGMEPSTLATSVRS
jgi:hypothetical protein